MQRAQSRSPSTSFSAENTQLHIAVAKWRAGPKAEQSCRRISSAAQDRARGPRALCVTPQARPNAMSTYIDAVCSNDYQLGGGYAHVCAMQENPYGGAISHANTALHGVRRPPADARLRAVRWARFFLRFHILPGLTQDARITADDDAADSCSKSKCAHPGEMDDEAPGSASSRSGATRRCTCCNGEHTSANTRCNQCRTAAGKPGCANCEATAAARREKAATASEPDRNCTATRTELAALELQHSHGFSIIL